MKTYGELRNLILTEKSFLNQNLRFSRLCTNTIRVNLICTDSVYTITVGFMICIVVIHPMFIFDLILGRRYWAYGIKPNTVNLIF